MNVDLYKQMIDLFDFITNPLWELFNDTYYYSFQGAQLVGVTILGLIASTYPSQISYQLGTITYCTDQMVAKDKWWNIPLGLFIGKLVSVYLVVIINFWLNWDRIVSLLEEILKFGGPVYLMLGLSFLIIQFGRLRNVYLLRKGISSFYIAIMISFVLSLFVDPGTILIMDIFIPWIEREGFLLGLLIPFFFSFGSFIPILVINILAYGFHGDSLIRKSFSEKSIRYFFGLVLIVLAVNQFFLYL